MTHAERGDAERLLADRARADRPDAHRVDADRGHAHQAHALTERATRQVHTARPATPIAAAAAPWLAVTGGKGGVGKTLVAVNVAILAARAGYRTLLADLDPGLANVDVHLRLAPRWTLEDLAAGACSPAEAIAFGPAGVGMLAGRSGSTALAGDGATAAVAAAHAALARAARGFDLVVCDTGAGIGPAVLATIERAAFALLVTTPDPAAATDAYALAKLLMQRGRPAPHLVVNRVRDREHALRTATRLSSVAQRFLGASLPFAGWLCTDAGLERSVAHQRPFATSGDGPAMEDLRAVCAAALSQVPGLVRGGSARAASR